MQKNFYMLSQNNTFSFKWIEKREFFDNKSRNKFVVEKLIQLKHKRSMIDLGCGTGSFAIWCLLNKIFFKDILLIDHDRSLTKHIHNFLKKRLDNNYKIKGNSHLNKFILNYMKEDIVNITIKNENIIEYVNELKNFDVISLSAISDLLSKSIIKKILSNSSKGQVLLFTLCFNGVIKWNPINKYDKYIKNIFLKDMKQDKGLGPSLGCDFTKYFLDLTKKTSHTIEIRDSSWIIDCKDLRSVDFQKTYLKIIYNALRKRNDTSIDILKSWNSFRLKEINKTSSKLVVGHDDIFLKI
ncbi:MAG: hypothetical protein CMD65_02025 [Gammaproteobacteria bacterium]|nr:hypothetical protein [Gammaproteobacteria bacterium]